MPIMYKKFKCKLHRDVADTIRVAINDTLEHGVVETLDDKLLFAALAELTDILYAKLGKGVMELSISLSPVQTLALCMFYHDYVNDYTSYAGNKLFALVNAIDKQMAV